MEEPPKRRRKLVIVDVPGEGFTGAAVEAPKPLPPPAKVEVTPGTIHSKAQQEILSLCRAAKCDEEKIEDRIWLKLDEVLKAKTVEEARELAKNVLTSAEMYFMLNKKYPEKQAKAAERLAKMHSNKGEDEEAKKQLEKAARIRADIRAEAQEKKP